MFILYSTSGNGKTTLWEWSCGCPVCLLSMLTFQIRIPLLPGMITQQPYFPDQDSSTSRYDYTACLLSRSGFLYSQVWLHSMHTFQIRIPLLPGMFTQQAYFPDQDSPTPRYDYRACLLSRSGFPYSQVWLHSMLTFQIRIPLLLGMITLHAYFPDQDSSTPRYDYTATLLSRSGFPNSQVWLHSMLTFQIRIPLLPGMITLHAYFPDQDSPTSRYDYTACLLFRLGFPYSQVFCHLSKYYNKQDIEL